ncbi:MAG TPA: TetR/AcrR family transcriptional regulator [Pirellulales bacterium]|jgi:AcrR family transcriptional regulator
MSAQPIQTAQSTEPCTPGRREERRQAIIETAARLFAELGYASCEMERVASELGIAKGTLYLYFSSKEALFYACVDAGMRQMQSVVGKAAEENVDPIERISRGIRAYLQFFEDHPEHVELLIQERANFKGRSRPTYFEYRDQNREKWRPIHAEMIARGRYRDDIPVERIMDAIGNLLYGTMFTNHFVGRAVSLNEQYQSLVEIVMRGLLSEQERTVPAAQGPLE